jgi:hypothetical protein
MAPTSSAARTQQEVKPSEPRLSGLIGAVRDTQATLKELEAGQWLCDCADRAIDRVSSRKAAALTMRIDAGLMTNQLKGVGHMSLRRIGLMDREFFETWLDEIRAHFGMDNDAERLDRAAECVSRGLDQIVAIARKGIR